MDRAMPAGLAASTAALCLLALRPGVGPLMPWAVTLLLLTAAALHGWAGPEQLPGRGTRAWGVALLAAAVLLPPTLSDDVWRYLADGRLVLQGMHPFAWAPASWKVADHLADLTPRVGHPHMHTIYPWAAQLAFAVGAMVGLTGWKALCTMTVAAGCVALGRMNGVPRGAGWWILLHPLVLIAVALDAHVDALGVGLVLLALRARRWPLVALAAGVAGGIKLAPVLVALPRAMRQGGWVGLLLPAASLAILLGGTAMLLGPGLKGTGSLAIYARSWTFMPGIWAWLNDGMMGWMEGRVGGEALGRAVAWTGRATPLWHGGPADLPWLAPVEAAALLARAAGGALWLGLAAHGVHRRLDPAQAWCLLWGGLLAVSPVVHPWYWLWWLPAAALLELPEGGRRVRLAVAPMMLGLWAPARVHWGLSWEDPRALGLVAWGLWLGLALPPLLARRPSGNPGQDTPGF
jgi:hypothetical protein